MSAIAPVTEIIEEIRQGRMVALIDDENRENEGDVILAADFVTPESINFMVTHCRGLVCLTLTEARCRQLGLEQMVKDNRTPHGTAFTASIEAARGVTTGISAHDRARTVQAAVARDAGPSDIVMPGHIFPLTAKRGGVLIRAGHTEAGCDLAQLAGLEPAAVICEIMNADGTMARLPDLEKFCAQHGIKIGTIRDLIEYRAAHEQLVQRVYDQSVDTPFGHFRLTAYKDITSDEVHFALSTPDIVPDKVSLVRVHGSLSIMDFINPAFMLHSVPVHVALERISAAEQGVLVMLYHQQSGQELLERMQQERSAGAQWDPLVFGLGAQILRDLGVCRMQLLTAPQKMPNMSGFGLDIVGFAEEEIQQTVA